MTKPAKTFLRILSGGLTILLIVFLWVELFPQSALGVWGSTYRDKLTTHTVVIDTGIVLSGTLDQLSGEVATGTFSTRDSLHFLYENVAEKNIKESFIKSAFDDCETFDDAWKKEKCSDTEKNTYLFADYTLNFSIATGSLYYTRDPASDEGSYEDGHIKIYVKDLSGLNTELRSRIDKELMDSGTRPWYIQTRVLSDYGPIGLGGGIESQEVYELPGLSFPKADFSKIFVFFGGQEYPLSPYIGLIFKKDEYLIGMFSYDNNYLPQERQENYFAYFQQDKFLNDTKNNSYFVEYLKKNTEFTSYVTTYLEKVFKVLEFAK